jgi:hypothetical protein
MSEIKVAYSDQSVKREKRPFRSPGTPDNDGRGSLEKFGVTLGEAIG